MSNTRSELFAMLAEFAKHLREASNGVRDANQGSTAEVVAVAKLRIIAERVAAVLDQIAIEVTE